MVRYNSSFLFLRSSIAAADYVAEIEQLIKMVSLSKNLLHGIFIYNSKKKRKGKKEKKRGAGGGGERENVRKRRKSYRRNTGPASQAAAAHKYINIA